LKFTPKPGQFSVSDNIVAAREVPVQWFLRYGQQQSSYLRNAFGLTSDRRLWTVNTGLNIALF